LLSHLKGETWVSKDVSLEEGVFTVDPNTPDGFSIPIKMGIVNANVQSQIFQVIFNGSEYQFKPQNDQDFKQWVASFRLEAGSFESEGLLVYFPFSFPPFFTSIMGLSNLSQLLDLFRKMIPWILKSWSPQK